MKDGINCPYCDTEQEINHDDGIGYTEDEAYTQKCVKCEKTFVYYTSISFYYKSFKAPCQNDGEHNWKVNTGYPSVYLSNFHTCTYCEKGELINKNLVYNGIKDTWETKV